MIEGSNAESAEEEQLEISVEGEGQGASSDGDDELDRYTKGVSKRINKLNQRTRDVEEQNAYLANELAQKNAQLDHLHRQENINRSTMLVQEEEKIQTEEQRADELYKRAVEAGDAALMSEATKLQGKLEIKKEKLRVARNRQAEPAGKIIPQENQQHVQQQQIQPVEPSERAKEWHAKNPWYGDASSEHHDADASEWAFYNHYKMVEQGFTPDSEEYFEELSNRVYKYHPHLQNAHEEVEQKTSNPPVQRVASAAPSGSRQKTQAKKNGVRFDASELETARRLKPHDISDEQWLQHVAREKQKIDAREAS